MTENADPLDPDTAPEEARKLLSQCMLVELKVYRQAAGDGTGTRVLEYSKLVPRKDPEWNVMAVVAAVGIAAFELARKMETQGWKLDRPEGDELAGDPPCE